MSDDSRARFEAWAIPRLNEYGLHYWCLKNEDGEYIDLTTRHAWNGWQASRVDALREAASVCEKISDEYQRREGGKYPELKTDAQTGASECEGAINKLADTIEKGES